MVALFFLKKKSFKEEKLTRLVYRKGNKETISYTIYVVLCIVRVKRKRCEFG